MASARSAATPSSASPGESRAAQPARAGDRSRRCSSPYQRRALFRTRCALRRSASGDRQHRSAIARLQQELETNRATLESANADVAACPAGIAAGSRRLGGQRPRWWKWSANRSSGATPFCWPSPRLPRCATASPRPRSALPRSIARRSVCMTKRLPPVQQLESFGGQRGQLGLEFETASQRVRASDGADRRNAHEA